MQVVGQADRGITNIQRGIQSQIEKIDDHRYLRCFKRLDSYGNVNNEPQNDPGDRPKTVCGGVISLGIKVYVAVLIISAIVQLFLPTTQVIPGDKAYLNYVYQDTGELMDFPALVILVESNITFFQNLSSAPNMQRVDMVDASHYSPQLSSQTVNPTTSVPPVTKSIYGEADVDFNTFDSVTGVVPSRRLPTVGDVDSINFADSDHQFEDTLKFLILSSLNTSATFFPHTALFYIRFARLPLSQCMTCQVQAQWMNVGEFTVLRALSEDFNNQTWLQAMKSLGTTTETWKDSLINSDGSIPNIFSIQKYYGWEDYQYSRGLGLGNGVNPDVGGAGPFVNWRFAVSYVNNFNTKFNNYQCRSNNIAPNFVEVAPPSATDKVIHVTSASQIDWPYPTPFEVFMVGLNSNEVVQVTEIDTTGTILTVVRPPDTYNEYNLTIYEFYFYSLLMYTTPDPPNAWTCDAQLYNDDICTCNCGAPDPACINPSPVENCDPAYTHCSIQGTCMKPYTAAQQVVTLSTACKYEILSPGDEAVLGYLGNDLDFVKTFCVQCTGDSIHNQSAVVDNGVAMCNLLPSGTIVDMMRPSENIVTVTVDLADNDVSFPPITSTQVMIIGGAGSQFTAPVIAVGPLDLLGNGPQTVTFEVPDFSFLSQGGNSVFMPYCKGRLISAITPGTSQLVVFLETQNTSSPEFSVFFPSSTPFQVMIQDGQNKQIATVREVATISTKFQQFMQTLMLDTPSSLRMGSAFRLTAPATQGSTTLAVFPIQSSPTSASYATISRIRGEPLQTFNTPIVIADPYGGPQYIYNEATNVHNIYLPYGDGAYGVYNTGEDCECFSGTYDPDCAWPTPQTFIGGVQCINETGDLVGYGLCYYNPYIGAVACENFACGFNGVCVNSTYTTPLSDVLGTGMPTNYPFSLDLQNPLPFDLPVGTIVQAGSARGISTDDTSTNYLPTAVTTMFTIQGVHEDILNNPDIDPNRPPYKASERYKDPPLLNKDTLPIEYVAFIVPDRVGYDSLNLCPNTLFTGDPFLPGSTSNPDMTEFNKTLLAGREFTAQCTPGFRDPPSCDPNYPASGQSSDDIFDLTKCQPRMKPVKQFPVSFTLPVNQRWSVGEFENLQPNVNPNTPEYTLQLSTRYYFTHDSTADENDMQFSEGEPPSGDLDSQGNRPLFTGSLLYMGTGTSTTTIPANSPLLDTRVTLKVDPVATASFVKQWKPKYWNYGTGNDLLTFLQQGFADLSVDFSMDSVGGKGGSIFLDPGKSYTITASFSLTPEYHVNKIDRTVITGWQRSLTSTRVEVNDLDYFHRQITEVQYVFSFNPQMTSQVSQPIYGITAFLGAIGSAIAYTSLGVVILKVWFKVTEEKQAKPMQPDFYEEYAAATDYVEMSDAGKLPLASQGAEA